VDFREIGEALLPWGLTPGGLNGGEEAELARRRTKPATITGDEGKKMANLNGVKNVAQRAWDAAKKHAPGAIAQAEQVLSRSAGGAEVSKLVNSKSPQTQQAVVKTLLDSGFSAKDLIKHAQLTPEEARQYAQLVMAAQVRQSEAVDSAQVAHVSSGDPSLDAAVLYTEIEDVIKLLGVSSDEYAVLLRGLNSHTSKDVERFQMDRKVRRLSFL